MLHIYILCMFHMNLTVDHFDLYCVQELFTAFRAFYSPSVLAAYSQFLQLKLLMRISTNFHYLS
jgi:hypothetical protein